jgi:hypothetical protein
MLHCHLDAESENAFPPFGGLSNFRNRTVRGVAGELDYGLEELVLGPRNHDQPLHVLGCHICIHNATHHRRLAWTKGVQASIFSEKLVHKLFTEMDKNAGIF